MSEKNIFFRIDQFWWTSHIGLKNSPGSDSMQDSQLIRGGSERYNIFKGVSQQTWFIEGVERSLHDAVMVVKQAIRMAGW
jgi:hypothetical protein